MPPALQLTALSKDYHGLRPLRMRGLVVAEGEIVALSGLDAAAAEVLTNLVTGATLPDEGSVRVFGEETAAVADADAWLAGLDRFGIVSDRVALLETFTIRQNIAIPLTLELDPLTEEVAAIVSALATEVGLRPDALDVAAGLAPPPTRFRVRVARAVATRPRLLLVEHPTGAIPRAEVPSAAADFFRLVRTRGMTSVIASSDRDFTAAADRHLDLDPATGVLQRRGLRGWFS
jgi:predicted ABC-type transport system involved in lysophospholipase L1 biosynthesis ATPase subunit